ncbi:lipopolysaccharide biosynthesis protein [Enterobacter cloacae]|uniref:Lipopolysaccharide biosynthesis protein n=1 Tax=Enterobacter cloacae TaxID=550 RepID=A0A377LYM2_ENTCL|nr:lipopolysaccharide biosynthesis protein [Enterobacter cloacae]
MTAYTQSVLALFFASQQCQRRPGSYIIIQFLNAIISAGATVFLFHYFDVSVLNRIVAMIIANIASLFLSIVIFYWFQKNTVRLSFGFALNLFKIIFFWCTSAITSVKFFAKGQVDRLLIYKIFSASTLGVYSVGYQLASIFAILLMAINKATVPYYYDYIKNGSLHAFKSKKNRFVNLLITPLPFVFFLIIPQSIYSWVLGPGFESAKYYAVLFALAISLTIPYLLLVNFYFIMVGIKSYHFARLYQL